VHIIPTTVVDAFAKGDILQCCSLPCYLDLRCRCRSAVRALFWIFWNLLRSGVWNRQIVDALRANRAFGALGILHREVWSSRHWGRWSS